MQKAECEDTSLKAVIKQHLQNIEKEIEQSLQEIDNERQCLLSDFEKIRQAVRQVESLAASFYLQCYLSSFTSKYSDLSLSVSRLMERRHGALIVIQREDPLDDFIHSGVYLGAALSHSLLESIFYPGNPLHDGAVLVRADQIVSAGNVLPVSYSSVLDEKLGMRHRAAVGLTEKSDALVLVVSEESGNASFAYKGKLHPLNAFVSLDEQLAGSV